MLEIKLFSICIQFILYICTYVHTYIHTFTHTNIHAYCIFTYMYIHTQINIWNELYIHVFTHIVCVHSNIHAYIHVFICCRSAHRLSLTWKYLYWKIQVTRNHPTWKRPQNGIVALRDTSVALNMALYLAESEQRLGAMITDVTNYLCVTHCCSISGGGGGSSSSSSSYCRSK